jgi:hypothetical protein
MRKLLTWFKLVYIKLFKRKTSNMDNLITDFNTFNIINECIENGGVLQVKPKDSDFWYDVLNPSFTKTVHFTVEHDGNIKHYKLSQIELMRCSK